MRVSASKSGAMIFCQKMVDYPLPQAKEFKYFGVLFTGYGNMYSWCKIREDRSNRQENLKKEGDHTDIRRNTIITLKENYFFLFHLISPCYEYTIHEFYSKVFTHLSDYLLFPLGIQCSQNSTLAETCLWPYETLAGRVLCRQTWAPD